MVRRCVNAFVYPLLLATAVAAQTAQSSSQTDRQLPKVRIVFADGVPYEKVWVGYGLFGPGGGRRSFDVPRPSGAPFYEVEPVVNGEAANRFKALVWAPGCKMKEFDVSLGTSNVELTFACEALKSVTLVGRVEQVDLGGKSGTISVAYDTVGPCLFLDTCTGGCPINCVGPPMPGIATAKLEADGAFKIQLPDFSADAIASGYSDAGFRFLVHGTQWVQMEPESKDFQSPSRGLRIASSYPRGLVFLPKKWDPSQIGEKSSLN
jgi:hypothetical protein